MTKICKMTNALTNIGYNAKTIQSKIWLVSKVQRPLFFTIWSKTTRTPKKITTESGGLAPAFSCIKLKINLFNQFENNISNYFQNYCFANNNLF